MKTKGKKTLLLLLLFTGNYIMIRATSHLIRFRAAPLKQNDFHIPDLNESQCINNITGRPGK